MERRPPRRLRQPRQVNPAINTQLNQDRLLFVPQSFFNPGADIPTNPTNHSVAVLYDVLLKFPEKEYGFGDLVLGVIENRNQRAIRLTRRIHQGRNLGLERIWAAANDPIIPENSQEIADYRIWHLESYGQVFPMQYNGSLWEAQGSVLV